VTDRALLASGRDADVYAIDAQRVLRRYRDGSDATAEAAIMAYVAELGFPVPHVYEAEGADLVMEQLDGPTMTQALGRDELDIQAGGALLADLHRRLHELPPRLSAHPSADPSPHPGADPSPHPGPHPGADPSDRILHLDLHPHNIMLTARGPVVIDWRNATEGPPDLDLALSALILAEVAVDETHEMAAGADLLLTAFLDHAGGDPLRMVDRAVQIRRTDPARTGDEVGRLAAAAHRLRRPNTP